MTSATHDIRDFQLEVIERSRTTPVLVDFWAPWCAPCRVLGPVLEKLAADAGGRWELAKVNTEEFPEESTRYGVMSIPNVKLFVNGGVLDEFVGALPEREIRRWLDLLIPSPGSPAVERARAQLAAGDAAGAVAGLAALLKDAPHDIAARLALAEAQLRVDPAAVEPTLASLGEEHADRAEALRRLAAALLDERALPAGAARESYVAALDAVRAGDWDRALESVIASMRTDRRWGAGAARELGRAIFILLGGTHPAIEKHHRAFAGAMYV